MSVQYGGGTRLSARGAPAAGRARPGGRARRRMGRRWGRGVKWLQWQGTTGGRRPRVRDTNLAGARAREGRQPTELVQHRRARRARERSCEQSAAARPRERERAAARRGGALAAAAARAGADRTRPAVALAAFGRRLGRARAARRVRAVPLRGGGARGRAPRRERRGRAAPRAPRQQQPRADRPPRRRLAPAPAPAPPGAARVPRRACKVTSLPRRARAARRQGASAVRLDRHVHAQLRDAACPISYGVRDAACPISTG